MTPAFDRIDHVHVYAADRVRAEQWYAEVLGLQRVPELEEDAEGRGPLMLQNRQGTVRFALFERPPQAEPGRSAVALSCGPEEFLAWRDHLVDKLARPFEARDHRLSWSLHFTDPDGNPWEITCAQHAVVATLLTPTGT